MIICTGKKGKRRADRKFPLAYIDECRPIVLSQLENTKLNMHLKDKHIL